MKKFLSLIIVAMLVLSMFTTTYAATDNVGITLPSFKISINSNEISNSYREYPFITYKGITYFPLTYSDCRILGLESIWDSKKGLEINKADITCGYRDALTNKKNKTRYSATIPSFNIKINGKTINNSTEEYPLLLFRDVTYFPMTWRFCVNEFGWSYKFDNATGLSINSTNKKINRLMSKSYPNMLKDSNIMLNDDCCYYTGKTGEVYKLAYNKPNNTTKLHQLPHCDYGNSDIYEYNWFFKNNNKYGFAYHQGGAIMGSDWYYYINGDKAEEIESGYITFKEFGDYFVEINQYFPPAPGNITIKSKGTDFKYVGDSSYCYGYAGNAAGCSGSKDLYLIGDYIYVLGFHYGEELDDSKVVKINIKTNETKVISDCAVSSFIIDGDCLYYKGSDTTIHVMKLNDDKVSAVNIGKFDSFTVLGNKLYYVSASDKKLYLHGSTKPINEFGKLEAYELEGDYLVCRFKEENTNPYRLIVIDKNGEIVLKCSDVVKSFSINNDILTYVEAHGLDIYRTKLK